MRHRGNGALGESDIEGKAARVAARMEPRGRDRHRWAKPRGRSGREHMSQSGGSERVSNERERVSQRFRSIDATPTFPATSFISMSAFSILNDQLSTA